MNNFIKSLFYACFVPNWIILVLYKLNNLFLLVQ